MTNISYQWSADVPPGKKGYSLYLNTNNGSSMIIVSNSWTTASNYRSTFDDATNFISVSVWAKIYPISNGAGAAWYAWVAKRGDTIYGTVNGSGNAGWELRRGSGNNLAWTIRGTTAPSSGDLQGGPTDDLQWHNYVGTYDVQAGIQAMYRDGDLIAITNATGGIINVDTNGQTYQLTIAGRQNQGKTGYDQVLQGNYVYDVQIFNYVLQPAEVAHLAAVPPAFAGTVTNKNLAVTWGSGGYPYSFLVSTTNLLKGPWNTNWVLSPYTITPDRSSPPIYYRSMAQ